MRGLLGNTFIKIEKYNKEAVMTIKNWRDSILRFLKWLIAALFVLELIAGCASNPAPQSLSPTDKLIKEIPEGDISTNNLELLFSNKTVSGTHERKGYAFKRFFSNDGTIYGENKKNGARQGKWRASSKGLCVQWANKKEKCRIVTRENNIIRQYKINKKGSRVLATSYSSFEVSNILNSTRDKKSVWLDTIKQDDINAYEAFLKKYPISEYDSNAKLRIEELTWDSVRRINTLDEYIGFLNKYPNSKYSGTAKEMIEYHEWRNTKKKNTIEGYKKFISKYSNSEYSVEAKSIIEQREYKKVLNDSLYKAAKDADLRKVKQLIEKGANLKSSSGVSFRVFSEDTKSGKTTDLKDDHKLKVEKICKNTISEALPEYKLTDNIVMGHATDMHISWAKRGVVSPTGSYPIFVVYEIIQAESKFKGKDTFLAKCLMNDKNNKGYISESSVALCPPNPKHMCLPKNK